jgi:hypothetical protein
LKTNTKFLFAFCLLATFMLAACSKHGNPAPSNDNNDLKNDTNVYVAGSTIAPDGYVQATYWKNGTLTILHPNHPNALEPSEALATATQGHDVFFAGYTHPDNSYPTATIWKNGVETLLNNKYSGTSTATGIAVNGTDVYVCGYSDNDGSSSPFSASIALCWKNGVPMDLEYAGGSMAYGISVKGSDVYVAGNINSPAGNRAVYWKNGKAVISVAGNITDATGNSIYVDGTDVYVAGSAYYAPDTIPKPYVATYWKNGKSVMVGDPTKYTTASFITVHNSDVYILGTLTVDNQDSPIYWKNGVVTPYSLGYSAYSAITFNGNDSYFLGALEGKASYIKNGKNVKLGYDGRNGAFTYALALSPY